MCRVTVPSVASTRICVAAICAPFSVLFAVIQATTALAQPVDGVRRPRSFVPSQSMRPPISKQRLVSRPAPAVAAPSNEPLLGVVSINRQQVTFYRGTERVAEAPISSGQPGHRTPTGVFSILQKARYHESNIYSGAPMPFMQRLTWSGIAMHAGNLPGYPASHGCIRMPHEFAERVFGMTKQGARVVVAPEPATPAVIAHERLPQPLFTEVIGPAATPSSPPAVAALPAPLALASAIVPSANAASTSAPATSRLNPRQAADHEKRRAAAAVVDSQQLAASALKASAVASVDAETAKLDIRDAEGVVALRRDILRRVHGMIASAITDEDRAQAWASLVVAEEDLADGLRDIDAARRAEVRAADHAMQMAVAARKAEDDSIAAEEAARVAARGVEPLSIFVSRKDNRVYLRQGFMPLTEGDVTIDGAVHPLGTHLFTVIDTDAATGLAGWSALTVNETGQPTLSASAALDRITIEPKVAGEISKRLWMGATLIISDHGISGETGKGTDFVVLTK